MPEYIIHDAEKEKPGRERNQPFSVTVSGWTGKWYDTVYYSYTWDHWKILRTGEIITVTHWTSLPPDPPKPKRWVRREYPAAIREDGVGGPRYISHKLPLRYRNAEVSYEVEEE